ncbi:MULTISPECIES: hypothetical protein [Bacillaceae]|uniref:hypothetical protein n=1 Tax=Bacillaceae TaxID=186817 RepID=UPI000BEC5B47|nr:MULTISPECIES: hypothetical protein [unclassified Bacillus (in: firmicutes)]PEC48379.1 hypothetical protein CON00_15830 [Bacillus sp. AFS096315]PFM81197.1 hypothetical protein COJ46_09770 [Bacillus sp. AFS077874]
MNNLKVLDESKNFSEAVAAPSVILKTAQMDPASLVFIAPYTRMIAASVVGWNDIIDKVSNNGKYGMSFNIATRPKLQ